MLSTENLFRNKEISYLSIYFTKDAKSLREKELKSAEKKLAAAKSKSEESTKQTKLKTQVTIADLYTYFLYL